MDRLKIKHQKTAVESKLRSEAPFLRTSHLPSSYGISSSLDLATELETSNLSFPALLQKLGLQLAIKLLILTFYFFVLSSLSLLSTFSTLFAADVEPYIEGKEGRNYAYKKLFRKNHDYYETMTIEGDSMRIVREEVSNTSALQFLPDFDGKEDLLSSFHRYAANDFVELSFEMKDFPSYADTLYILNRLLDIKTMTGIPYFSTSEQKMTTYITSCYIVDKARSRKELPPPQFKTLPTEPIRFVIRQDDNRFAATWYDVTIRITPDGFIHMTMENIRPIYIQFIFLFKALDTGKVRHEIVIQANGSEAPRIYALSQIHNTRTSILGQKLDLGNSFNRRMSAIQGWISNRIYGS